jgi:hypothetical protein
VSWIARVKTTPQTSLNAVQAMVRMFAGANSSGASLGAVEFEKPHCRLRYCNSVSPSAWAVASRSLSDAAMPNQDDFISPAPAAASPAYLQRNF